MLLAFRLACPASRWRLTSIRPGASHRKAPVSDASLPLAGIRVVEFAHMVMGPTCGLILGDLGAEVIKVEPPAGDNTRRLKGSGAGFFPFFNRNKKSVTLDLQQPAGLEAALKLVATADIVSENFKPGTMKKLGLDYAALRARHPSLIYVSHKAFLPGPYYHRTALDEVVQMMGGLAYMTGPEGRPLRAGASVNDIMGGMFGAIGALAALRQRETIGRGQEVQSALFENNVFLVAQHMVQFAVTGQPASPMPSRISAWGIYDVFTVRDDAQIFLAVVSDTQWLIFCQALGYLDLLAERRYATNNDRVDARDTLIAELRRRLVGHDVSELSATFEANGLPFAPITRPQDLFDDPHVVNSGGLGEMALPDGDRAGATIRVPLLPFTLDGIRPGVRLGPPRKGQHSREVLASLGYDARAIEVLQEQGVTCPCSQAEVDPCAPS
jgi:crotonobetainyl-CoA:carnitine CoA-transferase CaiB-like acyl-CoA transferase